MSPGITVRPRSSLILRGIGYTAMALAGGFVAGLPLGFYLQIIGVFLLIGGLLSVWGQITDRWAGEFLGLPLIATAMLAFSVTVFRDSWDQASWGVAPLILLLAGFGILLWGRFADVLAVRRIAKMDQPTKGDRRVLPDE